MRTLLVTAHPVETSFNAALARAAREGLEAGGATVDLWDLYAEGFDPVMSRADRLAYHDEPGNAALAQGGLARLQQAEALVLCFPAWISSPPAMMKGWLEKLMLPGVAFSLAPWRPRLTNIHTIAGVVTYGGARWRNWLAGDSARKMVTRGVWGYTGWRARMRYCAMYAVDKSTLEARQAFLGNVSAKMQRLAEQAPGRPAAPPKAASAPNS